MTPRPGASLVRPTPSGRRAVEPKQEQENGKENSKKGGQEGRQDGSQENREGNCPVTPHERRERRIDIEGEIKQVLALITECEADETDKAKILASAKAATAKQRGRLADLMDEVDRLAADTHADWQSLKELGQPGLPVTSDQDEAEAIAFAEAVQHPRGAFAAVDEAKLNAIFHEATNP